MNIRLRWWRVKYMKSYEPKNDDALVKLIWAGWNDYGWAWRWECRKFKNMGGQTITTRIGDGIFPRTDEPPPMRLKYYPSAT